MVSWSDITQWSPEALETAYDVFEKREATVQTAGDELWAASGDFGNVGEHAEAARKALEQHRQATDKLEALLSDLMAATRVAATEVRSVQQGVEEARGYADRERLTIDSGGGVSINPEVRMEAEAQADRVNDALGYPAYTYDMMPAWTRATDAKQQLERFIQDLVNKATDADSNYANALNAIAAGTPTSESMTASAGSSSENIDSKALLDLLNSEGSVADKRAAWDALSPEQQQALIDGHPVEIGAMNGVPFEARVQANDHNIDREVGELDERIKQERARIDAMKDGMWYEGRDELIRKLEAELAGLEDRRNYFESLKSGDGNGAVLFDPDNNRVIEMIGDPTQANVKEVVTFVPGTTTDLNGMGKYSALPSELVAEGARRGEATVGFNFYDGRHQGDGAWIEWLGGRANSSDKHLNDLGANLAEFQEALAAEDFSRGADNNVLGHSAGHSVVAASEVASQHRDGVPDAHYDNVHSLSGSYMPKGWTPQGATEYDHYAYHGEPIHVLDPVKANTPNSHEYYEQHRNSYNDIPRSHRGWFDRFNPGDIHVRSARGDDSNLPIIEDLKHEIFED